MGTSPGTSIALILDMKGTWSNGISHGPSRKDPLLMYDPSKEEGPSMGKIRAPKHFDLGLNAHACLLLAASFHARTKKGDLQLLVYVTAGGKLMLGSKFDYSSFGFASTVRLDELSDARNSGFRSNICFTRVLNAFPSKQI